MKISMEPMLIYACLDTIRFEPANDAIEHVLPNMYFVCSEDSPTKVHSYAEDFVNDDVVIVKKDHEQLFTGKGYDYMSPHSCLLFEKMTCGKCDDAICRRCCKIHEDGSVDCLECHKTTTLNGKPEDISKNKDQMIAEAQSKVYGGGHIFSKEYELVELQFLRKDIVIDDNVIKDVTEVEHSSCDYRDLFKSEKIA